METNAIAKYWSRDPKAKGQWWHFVAAVKTKEGREYGVQFSEFDIHGRCFTQCALTDVREQKHIRHDEGKIWQGEHTGDVWFSVFFNNVELVFNRGECRDYTSETSVHVGMPRMCVSGTVQGETVSGVGCFDREIFDRLLLPGETGWDWWVHWLDNGETKMGYQVFNQSDKPIRHRLVHEKNQPMIVPLVPYQEWPATDHSVGYSESLIEVCEEWPSGKRIGIGYLEQVGLAGVPDL